MSILLKIQIESTGQTKTLKFPPDIACAEILRDLREKFGGGKDHGLFQAFKKKGFGRWLKPKNSLRFYDVMAGTELQYKKKHRMLKIKMVDGATKTVVTDVSAIVEEVRDDICKHIRIANPEEYGLRIEGKPKTEWLKTNQGLAEQGLDESDMYLIIEKRFFYYDQNIDRSDPVQLHLLYVQARNHIVDGSYPCSKEEAIALAAVQSQIENGDFNPARMKPGFLPLPKYLSRQWVKQKNIEKSIYSSQQKLVGMSEINAKYRYVQMVRALGTYGITFFEVKYKSAEKKTKGKILTELLGITKDRLMRCRLKTREVYKEFPLPHLKRWAATAHNITLDFGQHEDEYLIYVTNEGEAISALIAGYIDIILKARRDVAGMMEEDDSAYADVSDVVAQRGQATMTMSQGNANIPQGQRVNASGDPSGMPQRVPGQRGLSNQANPANLGAGPQGSRPLPESEKVKILDLKGAQKALKLLVDELEDPNKEHFKAIADIAEMGLPQWRDQLGDSAKAIKDDIASLASALEGNLDTNALAPLLRENAKKIGEDMRKLGRAGKALTALKDMRGLDAAVAKVARATSNLLDAANKLANNPHDPKTKAAFLNALKAQEAAGTLLDAAISGELCDAGTENMLKETANLVSGRTKELMGLVKASLPEVKDGNVMRAIAGDIKRVAAAEKAFAGTVDLLAGAALNPVARKKLQDASGSLLDDVNNLVGKVKGNASKARAEPIKHCAMDVQNALNQINAAADCAEPNYAEIDLFEPHSMLMKSLPALQNLQNPANMANALKRVMLNGSNLAKSARVMGHRLGDDGVDLRDAAKNMANSLEDLLKLAKVSAQNPQDKAALAAVRQQAAKIGGLAELLAAEANIEDAGLRKAAKDAITGATALSATMGNVAASPHVDTPTKKLLRDEAAKVGKALPQFVESLKWATKDPNSREAQNNLLDAAKKAVYPMSSAVASVKRASPKVKDGAQKAKLNNAALAAGDKIGHLARAIKDRADKVGDKDIDEALDKLGAVNADLEAQEFAVDAGAYLGDPGETAEGASLLLAQAGEELARAMNALVKAAKDGKPTGDFAKKAANASANVAAAAKALVGTVKDKTTQKKILDAAKNVNQSIEDLLNASKSMARNPKDPNIARLLDAAAGNIKRALDDLVAASKGLDTAEINDAISQVKNAMDRLDKKSPRAPAGRSFKDAANAVVGTTKALTAATRHMAYTAKKNPRGLPAPTKMVASTLDNLVSASQTASALAPDRGTGEKIKSTTRDLLNHAPTLMSSAAVAAANQDPKSKKDLDQATKVMTDKIRNVLDAVTGGSSFPEIESGIRRLMDAANALDHAKGEYRAPEELLKEFETSTQALASSAAKVMSAARGGSPKLSDYAKDCIDSVSDILAAAACTGAEAKQGDVSMSGPGRACIKYLNEIMQDPTNFSTVANAVKQVAQNASKMIGKTKENAQRMKSPEQKQAALKLAHAVAQGTSGLARAAHKIQRDKSKTKPQDVRALKGAVGQLKGAVMDVENATQGSPANITPLSLDKPTVDRIKMSSKRLALNTTNLLQAATQPKGSGDQYSGIDLSGASKQVSEAIQDMLDACKVLDPAMYECDNALIQAQSATQSLDEAIMQLALGRLDKSGATDPQKAQGELVAVCKNVATNMAKLVNGARGNSSDLQAAAHNLGEDLPNLVELAKMAAISTQDPSLQKDLLQISRELADGLSSLLQSCKVAKPDNRESQTNLLGQYKSASNTLGQLVTKLKGNAMVAQEMSNTIGQIKKYLDALDKPAKPSGRGYGEIKTGLASAMKSLSDSALKLSSADKSNIGQISMETKGLSEALPLLIKEGKDAIATTSEKDAKQALSTSLKKLGQGVLSLAESARLCAEAPGNSRHQKSMLSAINTISSTMGDLGKAVAMGSTGERLISRALKQVEEAIKKIGSAAIFAQAGQLDSTSSATSEELMGELMNVTKVLRRVGKDFDKAATNGNATMMGKVGAALGRNVTKITELAVDIGSKMSDPDAIQGVLTATKALDITAQQVLMAGRDVQNNPNDKIAMKDLASATSSYDQSVLQLVSEAKAAAASANRSEKQLDNIKQDIEFLLNNPLPQTSGRPEDVITSAKKLHDTTGEMVLATTEDEIIDKGRKIFDATKTLLYKARGVTRLSADKMASQHLIEASRQTAKAAAEFVEKSKIDRTKPGAKNELDSASAAVTSSIREVVNNMKAMFPDQPIDDFTGGDIESIHQRAENSLAGASRAIDEATKLLMGIKIPGRRGPRDPNVIDMTDISEGILDAAKAVAKNTGVLIRNATVVQGERKNAPLPVGKRYHANPTWGKGLISAAHTVGAAINYLVSTCDKTIKGKIEEEALIAAAHQVNAATAQLVSASNVRVDPNSPNLAKLADSAKGVAKSTQQLISKAQEAADYVEEQKQKEERAKFTLTQDKIKAMEQHMKILKLENELQKARQGLTNMHKDEYKG